MRRIGSIVFWTFLVGSCPPLFLLGLCVWLVTRPFDPLGRVQHLYSCAWAQLYFWVNPFWQLRIEGREKLPWKGAAVLVSSHESLGDILALFGLYRPYKWVSKASVFRVPFVGWNMRLNGYVPLVRGDKQSILRMMDACRRWLDRQVPVMIFPEGTRSEDGTKVGPFKDGAFRLAIDAGCPVYPIVVHGTSRSLPKHGFVIRENARCVVRVLDPVDPKPFGDDVSALRDHVRALIVDAKDRLVREDERREKAPAPSSQRVESSPPGPA